MRMSLICCPFNTSYGAYGSSLKSAIESKSGGTMQWVGSNCGCGDAMEVSRQFITDQCDYFEMPILRDARSRPAWQREAAGAARTVVLYFRAKRYAELSKDAELVHFQQVVNATGSKAVFHWLRQLSTATRIVTVHELDADQLASPEKSEAYNRADAVIVHCDAMREQLIGL